MGSRSAQKQKTVTAATVKCYGARWLAKLLWTMTSKKFCKIQVSINGFTSQKLKRITLFSEVQERVKKKNMSMKLSDYIHPQILSTHVTYTDIASHTRYFDLNCTDSGLLWNSSFSRFSRGQGARANNCKMDTILKYSLTQCTLKIHSKYVVL